MSDGLDITSVIVNERRCLQRYDIQPGFCSNMEYGQSRITSSEVLAYTL